MRILLSLLLLLPSAALAQVTVHVGLPTIRFEVPPPLVVVETGVQVVEDCDEDLYVVDGWYWARRGDTWYRARDHHGRWERVHVRYVPTRIVHYRPGQYRRWRRHDGHVQPARRYERHDRDWDRRRDRDWHRDRDGRRDGHRDGHRDHDGHRGRH